MTTNELRAQIKALYIKHTTKQISELCGCTSNRVYILATRMGIKCKAALRHIEQHHARILELSKTKTPSEIAMVIRGLGLS